MRKYLNIFSVMMLIVYGTLAIAAASLHHHVQEDVEKTHHSAPHSSHECGICSVASTSITFPPAADAMLLAQNDVTVVVLDHCAYPSLLPVKEYPRRGPPPFLS